MYRYLVVDGYLSGTGIRDYYEGGYIELSNLKLSADLIKRLGIWLEEYKIEHYNEFANQIKVKKLDEEGKEIARLIKQELVNSKLQYFSAATSKMEII